MKYFIQNKCPSKKIERDGNHPPCIISHQLKKKEAT
jgi:hypothetical protein